MPAFEVTKLGISQVFEGPRVFEHLTTEENLIAGAHLQRDAAKVRSGIERVYRRIVLEGSADSLRSNSDIREFYLGLKKAGSRKSYRDVKRYKRRKRWLS